MIGCKKGKNTRKWGKKEAKEGKREEKTFLFLKIGFSKMDTVKKKKSRYSNRGKAHIINLTNSFFSIIGNANEI